MHPPRAPMARIPKICSVCGNQITLLHILCYFQTKKLDFFRIGFRPLSRFQPCSIPNRKMKLRLRVNPLPRPPAAKILAIPVVRDRYMVCKLLRLSIVVYPIHGETSDGETSRGRMLYPCILTRDESTCWSRDVYRRSTPRTRLTRSSVAHRQTSR